MAMKHPYHLHSAANTNNKADDSHVHVHVCLQYLGIKAGNTVYASSLNLHMNFITRGNTSTSQKGAHNPLLKDNAQS